MRRLTYSDVAQRIVGMSAPEFAVFVEDELPAMLCDDWIGAYRETFRRSQIVVVTLDSFSYLFDLEGEHTLAAFGVMSGKNTAARDHGRMAGFPKSEGPDYHRGHLIPHTGNGGTDINLFIQLGAVNIGQFRALERQAVARPGCFYFVRLLFGRSDPENRPGGTEQGLILPGPPPSLQHRHFPN